MKTILLILLLIYSQLANAQYTYSISPSSGNRGQFLTTTITPSGSFMTISSGIGSMYDFHLEKGAYKINDVGYSHQSSGLGFALYTSVNFNIPPGAPPGLYNLVVANPWLSWSHPVTVAGAFQVNEAHLSGRVFFDANQNGLHESTEFGIGGCKVLVNQTVLTTDWEGMYRSDFHYGSVHDSLILDSGSVLTTPNSSYQLNIPPVASGKDFGIFRPADSIYNHDLAVAANSFRCSRQSNAYISVSSRSNNIQVGVLTVIKNSALAYNSASTVPDAISGDTLRWNYQLLPFQSWVLDIIFTGGAPNSSTGFITIDSLFDQSANFIAVETDTVKSIVRCSYDPNDKQVSPVGVDSIYHYTLKSERLTYTIRFQNCGNDTAFNVTVIDNLDQNLDWSSFRFHYASHPCCYFIDSNGTAFFVFDNILLPDSTTDEVHSHGIIEFSIDPNPTIPDHTYVFNRAAIYFDFNAPVYTNLVYNRFVSTIPTAGILSFMQEPAIIFPNPFSEQAMMKIPIDKDLVLTLYDITGSAVLSMFVREQAILNSKEIGTGIFFYTLSSLEGFSLFKGKFVVTGSQ